MSGHFRRGDRVRRRSYKKDVGGRVVKIDEPYWLYNKRRQHVWINWDDGTGSRVHITAIVKIGG